MSLKKFKQALAFYSALPFLTFFGNMPMWILYRVSDFLFVIVSIWGYRKKVIISNLHNSFPEKSEKEIYAIKRKFYRHFCDVLVETIALSRKFGKSKIIKRIEIVNADQLNQDTRNGRDVVTMLGHYACWEWATAANLTLECQGFSVYRPLKNVYFDRYMLRLRKTFGIDVFAMKNTIRELAKLRRENRRFVVGLIADQSPERKEIQHSTMFLNQDTPVITGPEKLAQLFDTEVFFWKMEKPRRGHYRITNIKYQGNVKESPKFEITDWFTTMLEEQIKLQPELWLWSHRRWKYAKK